jgi:hypothetical protein
MTEDLQKKLSRVQLELRNTQKVMAPAPKARLLFTFFPYDRGILGQKNAAPSTDVTLPLNVDGSVQVRFTVLNPTQAEARNGQYAVLVCDLCKFAKGPEGFTKVDGRPDNERYFGFAVIPPVAELPTAQIDVIPPPNVNSFNVGITYRCQTCEVPLSNEGLLGTVHILGR